MEDVIVLDYKEQKQAINSDGSIALERCRMNTPYVARLKVRVITELYSATQSNQTHCECAFKAQALSCLLSIVVLSARTSVHLETDEILKKVE